MSQPSLVEPSPAMNCGITQISLAFIKAVTICDSLQFPSGFQLKPPFGKLSAARSVAFRVLLRASQASDVGSIPIARSITSVYVPKRSFTERSEDIVYTFGPKGLFRCCKVFSYKSI